MELWKGVLKHVILTFAHLKRADSRIVRARCTFSRSKFDSVLKLKIQRQDFGRVLTRGLSDIEAFLIWNPSARDSELYPELCWHNHVGMTRVEWQEKIAGLSLPGPGPLAWHTRARRATRAGSRAPDSAPGLPASRATARARCGLPDPARAVAALAGAYPRRKYNPKRKLS